MKQKIAIHWFRQDLRLADNAALSKASEHQQLLTVYILDDINAKAHALGEASRCWLHHSLVALSQSLADKLCVYRGNPKAVFAELMQRFDIEAVYFTRCYEPWRVKRDKQLSQWLTEQQIRVQSFNGSLLWEPWQINKQDGSPYRVFTPFYRKGCLTAVPPHKPLAAVQANLVDDKQSLNLDELQLLPNQDWQQFMRHWQVGERAAQQRLHDFIDEGLFHYKEGRNFPAKPFISRLSPHLHFGEISPNQVWYSMQTLGDDNNIAHFCSELGWREFSYNLLFHHAELATKNLQAKFDHFPWQDDASLLAAWQRGKTGVPMVDAGMRELWQTGFMHNRVRMIVGSFLVKNLLLHWQHGERWFWNTLVDADLANNSASWQWIAGCGADAAPYFRVFNPVTQGEKFDPNGDYVRRYLPELARLPTQYLFCPWLAPAQTLQEAKVVLGENYPYPIVDLKASRELALAAFASLKHLPK